MRTLDFLNPSNIHYILSLYEQYKKDPNSVEPSWRTFFEGFELALSINYDKDTSAPIDYEHSEIVEQIEKEFKILELINAYRSRGHLYANINPLSPKEYTVENPPIKLKSVGLDETDLDKTFQAGNEVGLGTTTLREILQFLIDTYCGTIGVEYTYIRIPKIYEWLKNRIESTRNKPNFPPQKKREIFIKLAQATLFEEFLHRKFVGQKRFSLEGAEAIIPSLDGVIRHGAHQGIQEFVIGMAHRGRLNVLSNIMDKPYEKVFGEFQGKGVSDNTFDGDVKYHLGYSNDVQYNGHKIHISLLPNPSHLESVDPVTVGSARARIDLVYDRDIDKVLPILIHGEGALSGQGIVYEVIQMSRLLGYQVGGTIHIVINNQIAFTTPPEQGRSSTYATDVAKVILSPVFHVNGDDPEAVAFVTQLAVDFRQMFNRDVFIDVVCYRKYGHNEGDEPSFTQPLLYKKIRQHKSSLKIYEEKLIKENVMTPEEIKKIEQEIKEILEQHFKKAKETQDYPIPTKLGGRWKGLRLYDKTQLDPIPDTTISEETIKYIIERITKVPEGFKLHRVIERLLKYRYDLVMNKRIIDWGLAEHLAWGSLLLEGHPVRLSGQDVERGTFAHRHAVLFNQETGKRYIPLKHLHENQAPFYIFNSPLSEYGVLGFEFGYSYTAPEALVMWEAQFGDFANGAQIIFDQYISSTKTKWQRMSGLVVLLPHGYEGQGPEHSSARIERYLNLCAENNMFVCNFTTPANLFHAFRRQLTLPYRKPLIVFTPKSMLRYEECISPISSITEGQLVPIIDDPEIKDKLQVKRILLCSGKIFYDLAAERRMYDKYDVAIIRMEQLYPIYEDMLKEILESYPNYEEIYWVQEEPINMGAWGFMLRKLSYLGLKVIGRKESPSPATGSYSQHLRQQAYIIKKALNLPAEAKLHRIKI